MRKLIGYSVVVAVAAVFMSGTLSAEAKNKSKKGPTLVDVAIELNSNSNSPYFGEFDVLIGALLAADPSVLATLSAGGQRTVFAPVDAAFEAAGITDDNVGDIDQKFLTEVLSYHVVKGRRYAESVLASDRLRTLQRGFLMQEGGVLTDAVGDTANIIVTDVEARNGIIHAIDSVVFPYIAPSLVEVAIELNSNTNSAYYGQFDILLAAVLAADPAILETLSAEKGQRTVFAPVDAAFEAAGITEDNILDIDQAFLTEILAYHVINGRRSSDWVLKKKAFRTLQRGVLTQENGVLTDAVGNSANIIVTDVPAKNGIIHAIDGVVFPYFAPTIVDVAIELNSNTNSPYFGEFDILIGAVLAADPVILETLTAEKGQYTVFAPVDSAFEAAGITEANVGDVDQAFLTDVLAYHVIKGSRSSEWVLKKRGFRTLQRGILIQSDGVLTDEVGGEASIIVTDVPAKNGMVHAIDAVVLPYLP